MSRIYVVIEYNATDAIAQGAFLTEQAAYRAMEEWKSRSGSAWSSWTVKGCSLNEL